ncbi:MAG: class I SAM-dependent methyltransferase [Planctomycetaceae bacterium]|jgi:23S rRNA (cytosine1962-C5)-methyltransferase|nr:class I SAM-dependent methyltransferase [Planctomycetaceae bacterium]
MTDPMLPQFVSRLQKNDRHCRKLARRQELDCFRVYDRDLPEFPFTIDRYADQLLVSHYLRPAESSGSAPRTHVGAPSESGPGTVEPGSRNADLATCLNAISQTLEVPTEFMHVRERRTKSDPTQQYQKLAEDKQLLIVREGGLRFYVNLTDYLDTGLFLDHRTTREKFRELARDKRVLNLFCYTGAFSVYAADGGAKSIVSVDLSNTYLNWAQRNLALNRLFDAERHQFCRADVLQYLQDVTPASFDLVILDPPTFSNSKAMDGNLDIQRDHPWLINQTLRTLTSGGLLYFSTNCRKFRIERSAIEADFVKDITNQTIPFDFQGRLQRWCFVIKKP